jgi:hypothetical protein
MAATKVRQSKLPRMMHSFSSGVVFAWTEVVAADTLCEKRFSESPRLSAQAVRSRKVNSPRSFDP